MFFWQNSMLHAGKGNLTSPERVNTMKQSRKHNLAGGSSQLQYPIIRTQEHIIFPIHQIPSVSHESSHVFSISVPSSSYLQPHPAA